MLTRVVLVCTALWLHVSSLRALKDTSLAETLWSLTLRSGPFSCWFVLGGGTGGMLQGGSDSTEVHQKGVSHQLVVFHGG